MVAGLSHGHRDGIRESESAGEPESAAAAVGPGLRPRLGPSGLLCTGQIRPGHVPRPGTVTRDSEAAALRLRPQAQVRGIIAAQPP
jgi:hypothetical protein